MVGLFSVYIPPESPLNELLGSSAKIVGYPVVRLGIELAWLILLYYFLLTNLQLETDDEKAKRSLEPSRARATTRETATTTTAEAKKNLLIINEENKSAVSSEATRLNHHADQCRPSLLLFLKSPAWNVLVKVNYAIMLTHFALFRFITQTQRELFLFTWFNFFQTLLLLLLLSYLLATIVHLTIEMPLSALVQLFVSRVLPSGRRRHVVAK
jgi:hypothetical protein